MNIQVFIGLGSNLNEPLKQLQKAIEQLKKTEAVEVIKLSDFYRSAPMGPQDQPDYINAVVEISTRLPAEELLDKLQKIENTQGRVREQRWGARTLDLDILLYGKDVIKSTRLIVPHKGLSERNFVLYPLRNLVDGDFEIPQLGALKTLLANSTEDGLQRLEI